MTAYYNEIEPAAAHLLRRLIADGVIAPGDVDERSVKDVQPDDLRGYTQCHFFAGGGIWSLAARLAGWGDDRPLWTGSCPCQPFSVAGKGAGKDDPRHLWPDFFRLISAVRPPVVMGEQVAGKAGEDWFNGVGADLERAGYAARAIDIPAAAVDAPHIRQRLYWCAVGNPNEPRLERWNAMPECADQQPVGAHGLADAGSRGHRGRPEDAERGAEGRNAAQWEGGDMADAPRLTEREPNNEERPVTREDAWGGFGGGSSGHAWSRYEWRVGADGKARRVGLAQLRVRGVDDGAPAGLHGELPQSDGELQTIPLLAKGQVNRVAALRILGNAIVAPLAAEVIAAFMEAYD